MVTLWIASVPQLVQVTGQASGCTNHDILRTGEFVNRPDHFRLADRWSMTLAINPLDLSSPFVTEPLDAPGVGFIDRVIFEHRVQFLYAHARVTHDG